MLRAIVFGILFSIGLAASGLDKCRADSLYLSEVSASVSNLTYHLRIKPLKSSQIECSLVWNYLNDSTYTKAEFTIPAIAAIDNTDTQTFTCRIVQQRPDTCIKSADYTPSIVFSRGKEAAFSAVLKVDANGARLCFGDRSLDDGIAVPYSRLAAGKTGFSTDRAASVTANNIIYRSMPARVQHSGPTPPASDDHLVGIWRYFDRDADARKVASVPDYNIAIVANSDDSYTIVYLGGDTAEWHSGDIKGYLRATPFENHYDLEWYDRAGHLHSLDTFADYLPDTGLLRLSFPLLGTSLRFIHKF